MDFPDQLRYSRDHEWIRLDAGGNTATVGITDFAQGELGDIVFVELVDTGTELEQNESFGTVEAVKTVSELFMPVAGRVVEHNAALADHPELVNDSPYEDGWMVKIEVRDPGDIDALMSAEEYAAMVAA